MMHGVATIQNRTQQTTQTKSHMHSLLDTVQNIQKKYSSHFTDERLACWTWSLCSESDFHSYSLRFSIHNYGRSSLKNGRRPLNIFEGPASLQ